MSLRPWSAGSHAPEKLSYMRNEKRPLDLTETGSVVEKAQKHNGSGFKREETG